MRMNLFRSEEHVKRWSLYEPESEDGIMPVEDWAKLFAGPMFRNRLDPDYLARAGEYRGEFAKTLFQDLQKSGPFWTGRR
jgi:hypothetical protein